jgi:hypothetical protein
MMNEPGTRPHADEEAVSAYVQRLREMGEPLYEYAVETVIDPIGTMTTKSPPLADMLNQYAVEGWHVRQVVNLAKPSTAFREGMLIVFERRIATPPDKPEG